MSTKPSSRSRSTKKNVAAATSSQERGIGDNSGVKPGADEATENKFSDSISAALVEVGPAVARYCSAIIDASNNVRVPTHELLTTIYLPIWLIFEEGTSEAFCNANKIVVHGNTRNPYYPYVSRFFPEKAHDDVRKRVSHLAKVIAVAKNGNLKPTEFRAWLDECGVEAAVKQYRDPRSLRDPIAEYRADEAQAQTILFDAGTIPLTAGTEVTKNHYGRKLAVIELDPIGTGDYRLVGVLNLDPVQVAKLVAGVARKQNARKK